MAYVLLRTGKIDVVGTFLSIKEAAEYIGDEALLGYQIVPLTTRKTPVVPTLPRAEQTRENLETWARNWPSHGWDVGCSDDNNYGRFLVQTEKRFPIFFAGENPAKLLIIKALRQMTYEAGVENAHGRLGLELNDAKELADDYFAIVQKKGA